MVGEQFDQFSEPAADVGDAAAPSARRFLGVHFACCSVYARVYVNSTGTAYEGGCPKCGRRFEARIGPGGTDCRFFTAY